VLTSLVKKEESTTTYYDRYKPPIIISWPWHFCNKSNNYYDW